MRKQHFLLLFFLIIGIAFIVSCSLDVSKLGVPVWTIESTIPFSERVYEISELVTDSVKFSDQGWGIQINESDSIMTFEAVEDIENQVIGDRLTYSSTDIGSYSNQIGIINIEEPMPDGDSIKITEVNRDIQPGEYPFIPAFELEEAQDTLLFDIFRWVAINQGQMYLKLINAFPFDLENVVLEFKNLQGDDIGLVNFGGRIIPAGETDLDTLELAGKMVENEILMTANATTPGINEQLIISGEESMMIIVNISDTEVDSANAEISPEEQDSSEFAETDDLILEDDNKILEASIKSGSAFFMMENTTKFKISVDMVFLDIRNENNDLLTLPVVMEPEAISDIVEVDLSGWSVSMPLDEQRLRVENRVSFEDTRITMHNGTPYQTIASYQGVEIEYWIGDLILHSLTGVLDSIVVDIPEEAIAIDLPDGIENITFTEGNVYVSIYNEASIPMLVNLEIIGSNSNTGNTVPLYKTAVIAAADTTLIVIQNANLLTSVTPDTIRSKGWAGLGQHFFPDNHDIMNVSEDNNISGNIRLKSDLRITIGESSIKTDPDRIIEDLDYPINDVSLRVDLKNKVPIGGTIQILLGNDTLQMDTILSISIPVGEITNHRVEEADTSILFSLSDDMFEIMKSDTFYTQQLITFTPSLPDTVWIHAADYLSVQASATIFYTINPDGEDE